MILARKNYGVLLMKLFRRRYHELDMIRGPLFKNILSFAIPISLSGILQLLFNLADMSVVGKYAEESELSLAAIGSNGPLINILVQLFVGFSVGANIVIARSIGEANDEKASRASHTALVLSVLCGFIVMAVGLVFCRTFLTWLLVPSDVIDLAESYMRIYFYGVPLLMIYNFGASILRANGETKRPLYYLTIGGVVNVILNIVFVKYLHWDVVGVAVATCVSELISSVLVVLCLMRRNDVIKIRIKKLRMHKRELLEILRDGIPAGLHSSMYSIANVIIQSHVNSFGAIVMAANSASFNLTNIVGVGYWGFVNAATTFTSQNMGAKQYSRIKTITRDCLLSVIAFATAGAIAILVFQKELISIFNDNPEILEASSHHLKFLGTFLFLDGSVSAFSGIIRGMGKSFQSMVLSIVCICGVRLGYLFTYFLAHKSLDTLYVIYPISWIVALIFNIIYYIILIRKLPKEDGEIPVKDGL